ncbi:MAG: hypothetical protein FJ313_03255, partial [Gemmatimonadetes bacterium]|nr:hypothetical protein [Gemmatimonadota bacterium]
WLGAAAVLAVIIVAVLTTRLGGGEERSPTTVSPPTAAPRPATPTPTRTPTPTPTPVLSPIRLDPGSDAGAFFDAIPAAERQCAAAAVGQARFVQIANGAEPSESEGRAMLACLGPTTWARMFAGALLADAVDVSPATVACMGERFRDLDLIALMNRSDLSDEEAFIAFAPALFCLNDRERAALERSESFAAMPAGITLDDLECVVDALGPTGLQDLASLGEGGELPRSTWPALIACGLDRLAMPAPTATAKPPPTVRPQPTPSPRPTATPTPVREWAVHGSPDSGFTISVPGSWRVFRQEEIEALAGSTAFFAAIDEEEGGRSGFGPNVNVMYEVLPPGTSLDGYVERSVAGLNASFSGNVEIKVDRVLLPDREAGRLRYSDGTLAWVQFLTVERNAGFVLTCTASVEQAQRYAAIFHEVARSFRLFLPEETPTPTPTPPTAPEEIDLGTVAHFQTPKVWTVDLPRDFARVEIGTYGKGDTTVNKYGGWNAWLKINAEAVWEFRRFDPAEGGIIYDYILGSEILETTGKGQYLDATFLFRPGSNTVSYYHYTDGEIGIKLRVWRAGLATPTPTPTATPRPTPTPTRTPTPTPTPTPRPTPTPTPTRTPVPLPDLVPYRPPGWAAPLVYHGTPRAGEALTIDFALMNTASMWANEPFEIAILVDGTPAFVLVLPELSWQTDYRKMGATITVETPGPHLVELVVDRWDSVKEANEKNNTYSTVIDWAAP